MKLPLTSLLALAGAITLCSASAVRAANPLAPSASPAALATYATTYTEIPAWADSFADSVGVDSSYSDHRYPPEVTTMLEWSGIRHLRDSGPDSALMLATYANLGRHGINHSIGVPQGFNPAALRVLLNAFAPYVDFVEGPNEADNVPYPKWAEMKSDQTKIWNTVRSSVAYEHVAVYGNSFANPLNGQFIAPLDAIEDYAQLHNATCDWNPGTDITSVSIVANTAKIRLSSFYKPIVTTETGYNDNPVRGCHLSDELIAKYTPRTTAERWLAGEPRTYFTFLTDNPLDPVFGAKGLLFVNGQPKLQMMALGNLIRLLADQGVAPPPRQTSWGISGISSDVHHILLSRRDGSYDLMLWRELPAWDHFGHKAILVPSLPVTVTIPSSTSSVTLNTYDAKYDFTQKQLRISASGVTTSFNVTDAISVLHFYGPAR